MPWWSVSLVLEGFRKKCGCEIKNQNTPYTRWLFQQTLISTTLADFHIFMMDQANLRLEWGFYLPRVRPQRRVMF